jgi:hypothetical protein
MPTSPPSNSKHASQLCQLRRESLRAAEQDREDVAQARAEWRERQPRLDPARLVFPGKTWTITSMDAVTWAGTA